MDRGKADPNPPAGVWLSLQADDDLEEEFDSDPSRPFLPQHSGIRPLETVGDSSTRLEDGGGIWSKLRSVYNANYGLLLITISQLFGCAMNSCVKFLNVSEPLVHPLQLVSVRMFITYFGAVSYLWYSSVPYPILGPPGIRTLLWIRGITGFCGLYFMWQSLQELGIADATTLTFLVPSTAAVLAYTFLGELMAVGEICAGFVSLVGVVLIARPRWLFGSLGSGPSTDGDQTSRLLAIGFGMIGVLGTAGAAVTLRKIGTRGHILQALSYFAFCSSVAATIGMFLPLLHLHWIWPHNWKFLVLFCCIVVFGFIAQVLLVLGLQHEKAARGMIGIYLQVVFAGILDFVLFGIAPAFLSIVGSCLIIGSAVYVALSKKVKS